MMTYYGEKATAFFVRRCPLEKGDHRFKQVDFTVLCGGRGRAGAASVSRGSTPRQTHYA